MLWKRNRMKKIQARLPCLSFSHVLIIYYSHGQARQDSFLLQLSWNLHYQLEALGKQILTDSCKAKKCYTEDTRQVRQKRELQGWTMDTAKILHQRQTWKQTCFPFVPADTNPSQLFLSSPGRRLAAPGIFSLLSNGSVPSCRTCMPSMPKHPDE